VVWLAEFLRISIPNLPRLLWLVWSNVDLETMTIKTAALGTVTHSGGKKVVFECWPFQATHGTNNKDSKMLGLPKPLLN